MRGEVGKETPKNEMDFYDVTRDFLGFLVILWLISSFVIIELIKTDGQTNRQ